MCLFLSITFLVTCSGKSVQDDDCQYGYCVKGLCIFRSRIHCICHTSIACQTTNNCSISANETCIYGNCWKPFSCLVTTKTTAHELQGTKINTKPNSCVLSSDCKDIESQCTRVVYVYRKGRGTISKSKDKSKESKHKTSSDTTSTCKGNHIMNF